MKKFYVTPDTYVMSVYNEGVICTSDEQEDEPMTLPGTEWKDETIW